MYDICIKHPDSKIHGANMGPTWVLSAPGTLHVGPMNLAFWADLAEHGSSLTVAAGITSLTSGPFY